MFASIRLRFGVVRTGWVRGGQCGRQQYTPFYGAFSRLCHLRDLCVQFSEKTETSVISGPITIFYSWTLIFQPAFVLTYQKVNSQHIMFYLFTLVLVLILYRENKDEAKTIFVNEW